MRQRCGAEEAASGTPRSLSRSLGRLPWSGMLPPELPLAVNEAAQFVLTALCDAALREGLAGGSDDWDHFHVSQTVDQRLSQEGELRNYEVSYEFTVCPGWECGADPEPFGQWSRWRQRKQLAVLERVRADPAEEIAAASIPALLPTARVESIPEDGEQRTPDLRVTLPDGGVAMVEVTTHPDKGWRELMAARKWHPRSALGNEWQVLALDSRFLESYASGNSFRVNSVARTLADVLARVESQEMDLDNFERIGELCEAGSPGRGSGHATTSSMLVHP